MHKFTVKIIILLTFCFNYGYASFNAKEYLKEEINQYTLNQLFNEHHLSKTWAEQLSVEYACTVASELLRNMHAKEALPYLIYAESHYYPISLTYLADIALGRYKNIAPEICNEIKEKFSFIGLKDFKQMPEVYKRYEKLFKDNASKLFSTKKSTFRIFMHTLKEEFFPPTKKPSQISLVGISYLDAPPPLASSDDMDQQVPTQENHKDDDQAPLLCMPGFFDKEKED